MAIGSEDGFKLNCSLHQYFSQATWSRPESDNLHQPQDSEEVQMFSFMVFRGRCKAGKKTMRHSHYPDEWEHSSEITALTEVDHWG